MIRLAGPRRMRRELSVQIYSWELSSSLGEQWTSPWRPSSAESLVESSSVSWRWSVSWPAHWGRWSARPAWTRPLHCPRHHLERRLLWRVGDNNLHYILPPVFCQLTFLSHSQVCLDSLKVGMEKYNLFHDLQTIRRIFWDLLKIWESCDMTGALSFLVLSDQQCFKYLTNWSATTCQAFVWTCPLTSVKSDHFSLLSRLNEVFWQTSLWERQVWSQSEYKQDHSSSHIIRSNNQRSSVNNLLLIRFPRRGNTKHSPELTLSCSKSSPGILCVCLVLCVSEERKGLFVSEMK